MDAYTDLVELCVGRKIDASCAGGIRKSRRSAKRSWLYSMKKNMNNEVLRDILKSHLGHNVEIAAYGDRDNPIDICLECTDCNEVVLDAEIYTICAREDV